jgi:hypothetical protein
MHMGAEHMRHLLIPALLATSLAHADPVILDMEEFAAGYNPQSGPGSIAGITSNAFTVTAVADTTSFFIQGTDDKYAEAAANNPAFGEYVLRIAAEDGSLFRLLKLDTDAAFVAGIKADGTTLFKQAHEGYFFNAEWRDLEEVLLWADFVDGVITPSVTADDIRVSFNPDDHLPYVPVVSETGRQFYIDVHMNRPGSYELLASGFSVPPHSLEPSEVHQLIWPGDAETGPGALHADVGVALGENTITVTHNTYGSGVPYKYARTDMGGYAVSLDKPQLVTITGYFQGNWTTANWTAYVILWGQQRWEFYQSYNSSDVAPGTVEFSHQVLATEYLSVTDAFSGSFGIDQLAETKLIYTLTFTDPPVQQVEIDVDPWNAANEVRPNDSYGLPVAIMTTSIAQGDAEDFDASQADPDTLRLGPAMAPNVAIPGTSDFDGDGDADVAFAFRVEDAGIQCNDTQLSLTGYTYAGQPIEGSDTITTTECEASGCHP